MTNAGLLAGMRRCIPPRVFAVAWRALAVCLLCCGPMAPSTPIRITRKTLKLRPARDHESRRELTWRPGHIRRLTPQGRGRTAAA